MGDFFDERFTKSARQALMLCPLRVVVVGFIWFILGEGASWGTADAWTVGVLTIEVVYCLSARAAGWHGGRRADWIFAVVHGATVLAWSIAGVMLWRTGSPACEIASVGFFAGHLLYIQAHHGSSPPLILGSLSVMFAPAIVLLEPHYAGAGQMILAIIVFACAGHAIISFYVSLKSSERLLKAISALRVVKEEAEAASRAKSAFLATMSHEIRTPLNGVLGMAQAVAADAELPPRLRERMAVITQSGEAVLSIISDILDLSKIEAGKLEIETTEFELESLLRTTCATFAGLADDKGLAFRVSIEGLGGVFRGDPARLRQVASNLISNAVKFTSSGEVCVTARPCGSGCEIIVRDSGVGVPLEKRDLIFQRFTQADASVTRKHGGTGLGLAICRELVERMGGRIELESEAGQGAEFRVFFPLARVGDAKPAEREDAGVRVTTPTAMRILAAEDNETNQLVLKALLGGLELEATIVSNGQEALQAWREGAWDLVLMDVQMPVMDGVSATRAIRQAEALDGRPRTPIIALTANAMTDQVAEYRAAGMDDFVAKPISIAELFAAISRSSGEGAAAASNVA